MCVCVCIFVYVEKWGCEKYGGFSRFFFLKVFSIQCFKLALTESGEKEGKKKKTIVGANNTPCILTSNAWAKGLRSQSQRCKRGIKQKKKNVYTGGSWEWKRNSGEGNQCSMWSWYAENVNQQVVRRTLSYHLIYSLSFLLSHINKSKVQDCCCVWDHLLWLNVKIVNRDEEWGNTHTSKLFQLK